MTREAEALKRESEALEQQTATGEILRVISSSPTDVQPLFDTIAQRAKRLCNARECAVFSFDGTLIHLAALAHITAEWTQVLRSAFPRPPGRGSMTARAILTRSVVHVPDVLADSEYDLAEPARTSSMPRSVLSVPMLRDDQVVGAITVDRYQPGPFPEKQIALLQTFADQAVIAIENVRLFQELQAKNRELTTALDQQTATSEILRVISSSPVDVQPVFDTIVRYAVQLCGAIYGTVSRTDGDLIYLAAQYNFTSEQADFLRRAYPVPLTSDAPVPRSIRTGTVYRAADLEAEPEWQARTEEMRATLRSRGVRSFLAVPMLRRGEANGAIILTHGEVGAFSDAHVELIKTFADQAVIAIENVRLFTELQARNRALTEALDQQTATAEILRVISRSQTDAQPGSTRL